MKRFVGLVVTVFLLTCLALGQGNFGPASVGTFPATWYAYGDQSSVPALRVAPGGGTTASGAGTLTLSLGRIALANGRNIMPLAVGTPVFVDSGSNQETVTPTAVSCSTPDVPGTCSFTATFNNIHGAGATVSSASFGLQEAIDDAFAQGGGIASVDASWTQLGGTSTILGAALPYSSVSIQDLRGPIQFWNVTPSATAFLAVPTALTAQAACDATHTFCSDANAVGTWTNASTFGCVSYVDIMGNEGPCSTTASFTAVVSKAINVGAPAASTGAVGYTIYLSLGGGSYAFAYKVPLTSSICTLTKIETITAACAVTNATYGQTGSSAQVAAVTVNTSRLAPQLGVVSATTDYVPNSNAHTTYAYVPGSRPGTPGLVGSTLPYTITTAAATTVPNVLGTVHFPAGFMNFVGKTIRVCGKAVMATGGTGTITNIQFWWDADGSNAAGVPVKIGGPQMTATVTAIPMNLSFCQNLETTVAGAGATAGTMQTTNGTLTQSLVTAGTANTTATDLAVAAVGSLNLAGEARLEVVYLHTTGTDGAGITLQNLTVEVLN